MGKGGAGQQVDNDTVTMVDMSLFSEHNKRSLKLHQCSDKGVL